MLENTKTLDSLNTAIYIGRLMPVKTEAKEIILEIAKITNQVRMAETNIILKPLILSANPNNTPKVVAIPLPPWKLRNTVQLWPEIQLRPKIMRSVSPDINVTFGPRKSAKKTTGRKPFSISIANTAMPGPLPNTRNALVAPTFPEPNLRISMPFNMRPNI